MPVEGRAKHLASKNSPDRNQNHSNVRQKNSTESTANLLEPAAHSRLPTSRQPTATLTNTKQAMTQPVTFTTTNEQDMSKERLTSAQKQAKKENVSLHKIVSVELPYSYSADAYIWYQLLHKLFTESGATTGAIDLDLRTGYDHDIEVHKITASVTVVKTDAELLADIAAAHKQRQELEQNRIREQERKLKQERAEYERLKQKFEQDTK